MSPVQLRGSRDAHVGLPSENRRTQNREAQRRYRDKARQQKHIPAPEQFNHTTTLHSTTRSSLTSADPMYFRENVSPNFAESLDIALLHGSPTYHKSAVPALNTQGLASTSPHVGMSFQSLAEFPDDLSVFHNETPPRQQPSMYASMQGGQTTELTEEHSDHRSEYPRPFMDHCEDTGMFSDMDKWRYSSAYGMDGQTSVEAIDQQGAEANKRIEQTSSRFAPVSFPRCYSCSINAGMMPSTPVSTSPYSPISPTREQMKPETMAKKLRELYMSGVELGCLPPDDLAIQTLLQLEERFRILTPAQPD